MDKKENRPKKGRITSKQAVALTGVVLLVLLYIVTLLAAFLDSSASAGWFRISLMATIAVPLIIWVYAWMYARLTGRHTIGDPDDPAIEGMQASGHETEPGSPDTSL